MKAVILAAGPGTRLRPLTGRWPKCLLPIAGRPLIDHLLDWLRTAGVREVLVNAHHCRRHLAAYLRCVTDLGVRTFPERRLKGTAGALVPMADHLRETFLVVYGDILSDVDLSRLLDHHRRRRAWATVVVHRTATPERCGMCRLAPGGRLTSFIEKPRPEEVPAGSWANAAIYVLEPRVLPLIPPDRPSDFGADIFPRLIAADAPVYAYRHEGYLRDIGTLESYGLAQLEFLWGHGAPARRPPLVGGEAS